MSYRSIKAVRSEIARLINSLFDQKLVLDQNLTEEIPMGENLTRLTWPNRTRLSDMELGTVDGYLECLSRREYNLLLFDAAIVQISYDFLRNSVIGHRLVYFPCPVGLNPTDWSIYQEQGFGVKRLYRRLLILQDYTNIQVCSSLRFDFDGVNIRNLSPICISLKMIVEYLFLTRFL